MHCYKSSSNVSIIFLHLMSSCVSHTNRSSLLSRSAVICGRIFPITPLHVTVSVSGSLISLPVSSSQLESQLSFQLELSWGLLHSDRIVSSAFRWVSYPFSLCNFTFVASPISESVKSSRPRSFSCTVAILGLAGLISTPPESCEPTFAG